MKTKVGDSTKMCCLIFGWQLCFFTQPGVLQQCKWWCGSAACTPADLSSGREDAGAVSMVSQVTRLV